MNPVVADLLRIHVIHSRQVFLNPSVFYHPGQENCMVDDTSCLFDLSDTPFLAHVSVTYPQPQISWQLFPLPPQLFSCVISLLCRKLCNQELHWMRANRECTSIGPTYALPFLLSLISKIHPSLEMKYCRYMDTGSDMPTTPSDACIDLGKSQFLSHGGRLR